MTCERWWEFGRAGGLGRIARQCRKGNGSREHYTMQDLYVIELIHLAVKCSVSGGYSRGAVLFVKSDRA